MFLLTPCCLSFFSSASLRLQLGVLTSCLHEDYKRKEIVTLQWNSQDTEKKLISKSSRPVKSFIDVATIEKYLKVVNLTQNSSLPFGHVVSLLDSPTSSGDVDVVKTKAHVMASTVACVLEQRGYVVSRGLPTLTMRSRPHPSASVLFPRPHVFRYTGSSVGKLTALGRSLAKASLEFREEAFLILELLRGGHLNSARLSSSPLNESHKQPFTNEPESTLLTRIFTYVSRHCLCSLYEAFQPYSCPPSLPNLRADFFR